MLDKPSIACPEHRRRQAGQQGIGAFAPLANRDIRALVQCAEEFLNRRHGLLKVGRQEGDVPPSGGFEAAADRGKRPKFRLRQIS